MKAPNRFNLAAVRLTALAILAATVSGAAANYELTLYGTLGLENSRCTYVSEEGIVLGSTWSNLYGLPPLHFGFVARNGVVTPLQPLPGKVTTTPYAVNSSGVIVGASTGGYEAPPTATRWNLRGMPSPIEPLPITASYGADIGNDGVILLGLGGYGQLPRAATWHNGNLEMIAAQYSSVVPRDRNEKGEITGYSGSGGGSEAPFVVKNGIVTFLGGYTQFARPAAINEAGTVVGAADNLPIKWVDGNPEYLPVLLRCFGVAFDVNEKGDVIGLMYDSASFREYVVWRSTGELLFLDSLIPPTSNIIQLRASSINDSGQICGTATMRNQMSRGFLLTPIE